MINVKVYADKKPDKCTECPIFSNYDYESSCDNYCPLITVGPVNWDAFDWFTRVPPECPLIISESDK